jgi:endonuclease/exonuclease/phosphatase family metal-dependent hydrolase
MIVDKINALKGNKNYPMVFMGDLNARPDENTIVLLNQHLKDAHLISELPAYGHTECLKDYMECTFSFLKNHSGRIDYILIKEAVVYK